MPYKIRWHPKVRKSLQKLHPDISDRIVKKIMALKLNPFRFLEHYEGESLFKLRIGDYRALIHADLSNMILRVMVLNKRSRIYKR